MMLYLDFVVWMQLYPLVGVAEQYVDKVKLGKNFSDDVLVLVALTKLTIWFYVGYLLY